MIKKEFKLVLDYAGDYGTQNKQGTTRKDMLCSHELRKFFTFPKGKKELVGVLSSAKLPNSYELSIVEGYGYVLSKLVIEKDFEKSYNVAVFNHFKREVKAFIRKHGVCYGRIEWDVK